MASINFNDINESSNNSGDYKVGFFSMKNGEEAIVRFAINSIDDFELYTVHPVTVGQSSYPNRRVSCLRENPKSDPINMCPLCARGEKVQQRMYIKMIQYVNDNGRIVPKAVVWDRPAFSYAPQLKSYLDSYGPLTNIVCKIVRQGDGLETKYTIMPNLNPQMYNEQTYPKDFSAFDDFKVLGTMVMDRTFDEVNQFVLTGNFPQRQANNNSAQNELGVNTTPMGAALNTTITHQIDREPSYETGDNPPWYDDNPLVNNTYAKPQTTDQQINPNIPNSSPQMSRPTRYY